MRNVFENLIKLMTILGFIIAVAQYYNIVEIDINPLLYGAVGYMIGSTFKNTSKKPSALERYRSSVFIYKVFYSFMILVPVFVVAIVIYSNNELYFGESEKNYWLETGISSVLLSLLYYPFIFHPIVSSFEPDLDLYLNMDTKYQDL